MIADDDSTSPWKTLLFLPGEDQAALTSRFVELWAIHGNRFPIVELGAYVLKQAGVKDNVMRGGQIAQALAADIDILERVRVLRLKGPEAPDDTEIALRRRVLKIADNEDLDAKDRIAALRLAGELQGFVKKSVDSKVSVSSESKPGDFLAALAAKLPN